MQTMIENYLNGNLTDARRQAKRFSHRAIRDALHELFGYSERRAALAADYLKTGRGFQEACDAD